jgi:UDP-N-acetylglucosamine diphosphorylase/glucosamine-1-phosphate N-acetyltransferase
VKPITVVILAAGKGTRMKSDKPKVLHPLLGRPLLTYPLELAAALDPKEILVVVGHQAESVIKAFRDRPVHFVLQEPQGGTAHAVITALEHIPQEQGPLLILSGDVPLLQKATLKAMKSLHEKEKALLTFLTAEVPDPFGYGRVIRDVKGKVLRVVEERDARPEEKTIREINAGVYLGEIPFFRRGITRVGSNNDQGEFYLTDLIAIAGREGKVVGFQVGDPLEVSGINTRAELAGMERLMKKRKPLKGYD